MRKSGTYAHCLRIGAGVVACKAVRKLIGNYRSDIVSMITLKQPISEVVKDDCRARELFIFD